MARLIPILITTFLVALCTAQDKPNKPKLEPHWDSNKIQKGFDDVLGQARVKPNIREWDNKSVWPDGCRLEAQEKKLKPEDFKVYEVRYGDCGEPWHMCVHKDATSSKEHLADQFGKIPVGMRSYVRTLVAQPLDQENKGIVAHCRGGDITTFMKIGLTHLIHEIGHAMDFAGLRDDLVKNENKVGIFSKTNTWKDAVGKDSNVPTEYSEKSWQENFAETVFLALFDKNVPKARDKDVGPWKEPKKWDSFKNQYEIIVSKIGNKITLKKGSKCTSRLQNDKAVPKGQKSKRAVGLMPDLRIRDPSIRIIEVGVKSDNFVRDSY